MKISVKKLICGSFVSLILICAVPVIIKNENKLSAPSIEFNKYSKTLNWDTIKNADYYIISISGTKDGTIQLSTTSTHYNCSQYITYATPIKQSEIHDFYFKVKAVSYNSKYGESDWSKSLHYMLIVSS